MNSANGAAGKTPEHGTLEEELEESSVTDLRNGLLPTIDRIQQNPALRVLIRKHGSPRAVLMSVQTYDALKRLASLALSKYDSMNREERVEGANQRLLRERPAPREMTAEWPSSFDVGHVPVGATNDPQTILVDIQQRMRLLQTAIEASGSGQNLLP